MGNVAIIGAGLAGSLLAIYFAKRGIDVDVYEARSDIRKEQVVAGRSINLALSDRGIAALREVGMDRFMLAEAVPMYGRMVHTISGETKLLPYSGRKGEYINSVSRAGLNIALINEAEKFDNVHFAFNERCTDLNCANGEVSFNTGRVRQADTVIATDGAGSAVRLSMEKQLPSFESSSKFLDHGYKELLIPAARYGGFKIERNALHIWPRHKFMMIALPNFDGSFTCTLFLDKNQLATLDSERTVNEFFEREFPDAVPLMPTVAEDFSQNPTGDLGTVRCWPWNVGGKALLLGDSAHAMVPFYGQGMNCAFEDVRVLDQLIENDYAEWHSVFEEYGRLRKPNTDAIQEMAEDNFYEMRDATADPVFQRKRQLETKLEQTYPEYFSKYSMVTFREDLPYSVAKERGRAQDQLLMQICARETDVDNIDVGMVMDQLRDI
ncbi:MAG: FAD-dependent oxidoreductase [Pyrinomonadaceae bacterium]